MIVKFLLRRLVLISIITIILLIPCIFYNLGICREFNSNAKITLCNITHKLCYKNICYVNISYNNIKKVFKVGNLLNDTSIKCYYYNDIIEISLTENKEYYVSYIFFTILACLTFLIWFSLEIYYTFRVKIDIYLF